MEETTFKNSEWHITQAKKGWKVYSRGLRCYGTFSSIDKAYRYIVKSFPKKRGNIFVHSDNGKVIDELFFPLKVIMS